MTTKKHSIHIHSDHKSGWSGTLVFWFISDSDVTEKNVTNAGRGGCFADSAPGALMHKVGVQENKEGKLQV